jgi:HEAT repeat protein
MNHLPQSLSIRLAEILRCDLCRCRACGASFPRTARVEDLCLSCRLPRRDTASSSRRMALLAVAAISLTALSAFARLMVGSATPTDGRAEVASATPAPLAESDAIPTEPQAAPTQPDSVASPIASPAPSVEPSAPQSGRLRDAEDAENGAPADVPAAAELPAVGPGVPQVSGLAVPQLPAPAAAVPRVAAPQLANVSAPAVVIAAPPGPEPEVLAALAASKQSVRSRAARELGERGTAAKAAVPALAVAWFTDSCTDVQVEAVRALARIGPASVPELLKGMAHESRTVRLQAIQALTRLGPDAKPAVPALRTALQDPSAEVRGLAALALGAIGLSAADAAPALVKLLGDQAPVRAKASVALAQLGPGGVPALADGLKATRHTIRAGCAQVLALLGADAAPALSALSTALADSDAKVRTLVAVALGEQDGRAANAVPGLVRVLTDPEASVRAAAEQALLRVGSPAVPRLVEVAREGPDLVLRARAVTVLGEMGMKARDAVPTLVAIVRDKTPVLVNLAVLALGRIGPAARDARPDLRLLRTDADAALRAGAALALARIDPSDAESAAALQNEFVQIASLTAVAAAQAEQTIQLVIRQRENLAAAVAARREAALAAQQAAARKRAEEAEARRKDAYLTGLMNQLLLADQFGVTNDQLLHVQAKLDQLDPSAIPYLVRTINQLAATPSASGGLANGLDFT